MDYRQLLASHAFRKQNLDNQLSIERFDFLKQQKIALKDFNLLLEKKKEDLRLELSKEKEEWNNKKNNGPKKFVKYQTNIKKNNDSLSDNVKSTHLKNKLIPKIEIQFNSTKIKSETMANKMNLNRNQELFEKVQFLKKKVLGDSTINGKICLEEKNSLSEKKSDNAFKRKPTEKMFEYNRVSEKKLRKSLSNEEIIELIFDREHQANIGQESVKF